MTLRSSFGLVTTLSSDELASLRFRTSKAAESIQNLQKASMIWLEKTDFCSRVTVIEPERTTFDIHLEISQTFPHDKWALHASEMAHHARSALDNLNDRLFTKFATTSYDPKRIKFPITTNGKEWRNWKQSHRALPDWLIERYKKVQPFNGPYQGLKALEMINNQDKHVWLQGIGVTPTNLIMQSDFVHEGLDPIPEPQVVPHSIHFNRNERKIRIARVVGKSRIVEAPLKVSNDVRPELTFYISEDGGTLEHFDIEELVEIPRRVNHIIDYMDGRDTAFERYQMIPEHLAAEFSEQLRHSII